LLHVSQKTFVLTGRGFALLVFAGSLIAADPCYSAFFTAAEMTSSVTSGKLVSEYLEPAYQPGYRVFSRRAGRGPQKKFNLDHVKVGPTGSRG